LRTDGGAGGSDDEIVAGLFLDTTEGAEGICTPLVAAAEAAAIAAVVAERALVHASTVRFSFSPKLAA
jgi:hypothetical protein